MKRNNNFFVNLKIKIDRKIEYQAIKNLNELFKYSLKICLKS